MPTAARQATTEPLKPTPRITKNVITVGELFRAVRAAVLEEPRRADLGSWVRMFRGVKLRPKRYAKPACGTAGCLAGWMAIMLRPGNIAGQRIDNTLSFGRGWLEGLIGYESESIARRTVGSLFDARPVPEFGESDDTFGTPGTKLHAVTIARRIDLYLAQHPEVQHREIDVKALRLRDDIWRR